MRTCECGCGRPIPVANFNRPKDGRIKGHQSPARFLRGHNIRAERPPWWKGDDAGYRALHTYLEKHFPKAGICEQCGRSGQTDHALREGRGRSRERADYRELCRQCHIGQDGNNIGEWAAVRGAAKRGQAGAAALCRCGCDQTVEWDTKHSRWRSFADGHYSGSARLLRKAG